MLDDRRNLGARLYETATGYVMTQAPALHGEELRPQEGTR